MAFIQGDSIDAFLLECGWGNFMIINGCEIISPIVFGMGRVSGHCSNALETPTMVELSSQSSTLTTWPPRQSSQNAPIPSPHIGTIQKWKTTSNFSKSVIRGDHCIYSNTSFKHNQKKKKDLQSDQWRDTNWFASSAASRIFSNSL